MRQGRLTVPESGDIVTYKSDEQGYAFQNVPAKLEDVPARLLDAILYYSSYSEIPKALISELKEKREEINKNYHRVVWECVDQSYGEFENTGGGQYEYINGKEYSDSWDRAEDFFDEADLL